MPTVTKNIEHNPAGLNGSQFDLSGLGEAALDHLVDIPSSPRILEGYVSPGREHWLTGVWSEYDGDSVGPQANQKFVDRQVESLQELHQQLAALGDPTEGLEEFMTTFGIANFGRYDQARLFDQFLAWRTGHLEGIDTLQVAARHGDYNNAFKGLTKPFERAGKPNVMVFEVGRKVDEVTDTVAKAKDAGVKAQLTVLDGHGSSHAIEDLGIATHNAGGLKTLRDSLWEMASGSVPMLVLDSCSTAQDNHGQFSLAQEMSANMEGVHVVAADRPMLDVIRTTEGGIRFSNQVDGGSVIVDDTGELRVVGVRGTLISPRVKLCINGKEYRTSQIKGAIPSVLRLSMGRRHRRP